LEKYTGLDKAEKLWISSKSVHQYRAISADVEPSGQTYEKSYILKEISNMSNIQDVGVDIRHLCPPFFPIHQSK
jgi:hypothetical protein